MTTIYVQIRGKGSLTLPMGLRRKYGYSEGDVLTLIDLGDGSFILSPKTPSINRSGDRVAQLMAEQDVSFEDILQALDEEREQYYRDHYAKD
jgi:bifunctional DNA-binding transcriptional regulator/antitoxin component of YhaV-PrlF toxin-antitoxin module